MKQCTVLCHILMYQLISILPIIDFSSSTGLITQILRLFNGFILLDSL